MFYSQKDGGCRCGVENLVITILWPTVTSSVADPDPDPVGSGLFWSPGSGSGKIPDPDPLSTKRPHVIQIFSL